VPTWHSARDGFGVDRLSISFPVRSYASADRVVLGADGAVASASWQLRYAARVDPDPTVRHGTGPAGHAAAVDEGTRREVGVFVSVVEVAGRGPFGKVECNPARFADPAGCSLLPLAQVPAALAVMWAAASEYVEPSCRLEDANVKRVDVARDFRGVTSPSLYVEGLGPLRRPYARRSFTYNDPARANAQTLFVGSNAGGVRLYDQYAAYADKGAPEGSLRFEVEARSGWLEKLGVRTVRTLDAVALERVALERWEWSKMGSTVTGPVNAVQVLTRAVQAGEVKQAVADRLLGAMVRRSFGYGGASRRSEYRYRDVADRLGLTAEALWNDDLSRQASGRLDFDTGTEFLQLSA
jgi:hypothetical protein